MKANVFNDHFEITAKNNWYDFKAGDKLCFKDNVIITADQKLPGILTDDQIQKARELYSQGKSYRDIGKIFNVSHMTIYRALK
jgi:DNA invertase Pin-like site-specific DNA recombinase